MCIGAEALIGRERCRCPGNGGQSTVLVTWYTMCRVYEGLLLEAVARGGGARDKAFVHEERMKEVKAENSGSREFWGETDVT